MKIALAIPLAMACLFAIPCRSADFHVGGVDGLLDLTAAYGLGVRVDDADEELVLSLIHISEPTRLVHSSRMPSSA